MVTRVLLVALLAASLSAGAATTAPAPPEPITLKDGAVLYASRYDYRGLIDALAKAGGDLRRVRHVTQPADLLAFESGKRYKYVLDSSALLCVAPDPADTPGNAFAHPVIAGAGWVRSGGYITVRHDGKTVLGVTVDNGSTAYQPAKESLKEVRAALERLGVPAAAITEAEGRGPAMSRP